MIETEPVLSSQKMICFHCGDDCTTSIAIEEKNFCCHGCKTVYEILSSNGLADYYAIENNAGISMQKSTSKKFEYLNHEEIIEQLVDYQDEKLTKVQFRLPQIHCSACLWLLENLYQLNEAIQSCRVNFLKKEAYISFHHKELSLKELVKILAKIGYEPTITLDQVDKTKQRAVSRKLIYQVGLAGFAFGNIMLMSLPEYFGLDADSFKAFSPWFGWLNFLLATPVAFYSGKDYFTSAWRSLVQNRLNIDVPIALGVLVLYLRSTYEVVSHSGAGYFDSLCGLLFFLLLGRIFQEKIYHQLSFERDYHSYFPIAVSKTKNGVESNIPLQEVQKGDRLLIRNGELIPVDAFLLKGKAKIDNSFATGESKPIRKEVGDKIYAGGRQVGGSIEIEVFRPLNQSKLTRLWNDYAQRDSQHSTFSALTDKVSYWFTPLILFVAIIAGGFHLQNGMGQAIEVMSAVLIIACPCALALAAPFTLGHATRWLGRKNCYLREAAVIEKMAEINQLVFDKTGTLTYGNQQEVSYQGTPLTTEIENVIYSLTNQSNHPLSRLIKSSLSNTTLLDVQNFEELEGKGLQAVIDNIKYRIGSASWLGVATPRKGTTKVFIEKNNIILGYYEIENTLRGGITELMGNLGQYYKLALLSGDESYERQYLSRLFPKNSNILYQQSPTQKLAYIRNLQQQNHKVMMVGDGLNDAGALREAEVGVAIVENVNSFSPACDVILEAANFYQLGEFLSFARKSKSIVLFSFVLSFSYNLVGLYFAVQGLLSPVFAAILMPISSISVVAFVSLAVWWVRPK